MSNQKTFNEMAVEFMRIYYSCHPDQLPKDKEKAFQEMNSLHASFKHKLIEKGIKKNTDFFSDKFREADFDDQ